MDIIEEFKNELIAEFSILITNKIKEFEKSGKFESSKNFNKFGKKSNKCSSFKTIIAK